VHAFTRQANRPAHQCGIYLMRKSYEGSDRASWSLEREYCRCWPSAPAAGRSAQARHHIAARGVCPRPDARARDRAPACDLLRSRRRPERGYGYVHRTDQFQWMPGARGGRWANDNGYYTFVSPTRRRGARLLRGRCNPRLHDWMRRELAVAGAHIDAFEHCRSTRRVCRALQSRTRSCASPSQA